MIYQQKLTNCFKEIIGSQGIDKAVFEKTRKEFAKFFIKLKEQNLNLFNFSDVNNKLKAVDLIIKTMPININKLYVLGTGGASLTGQTICGIGDNENSQKKVYFIDNVDPKTINKITTGFDYKNSMVLVISKSGGTIETVAQFILFLKLYLKKLPKNKIRNHFRIISETRSENTIKKLADEFNINIFQHEDVGGRFSIFSTIALVPAKFMGLDIKKFLKGAKNIYEKSYSQAIEGAALNACFTEKNLSNSVLMPYAECLKNFTVWWCQIWAESLGKTDKAITPIRSLGTIDQHSQLQLYLEGKKDKLFTIIVNKENVKSETLTLDKITFEGIDFLKNKKMQNIMQAAAYSTIETIASNKLPVRSIEIEKMNEETLGALAIHFILETVLMAKYLKINAYDQPAVEQGKKIAIKMLKGKK